MKSFSKSAGLFILLASFIYGTLYANQVMYSSPVQYTATATASPSPAMAANSLRTYLIITNKGNSIAYVNFGGAASPAASGLPIPPGGNYEPYKAPAQAVYLLTTAGTTALTLIQGN